MTRKPSIRAGEQQFLAKYDAAEFGRPSLAVDLAIFTVRGDALSVLLVERGEHPFRGVPALPGGFLRVGGEDDRGEDLDAAAKRELAEETGLEASAIPLEQFGAFGKADRDPRTRVVSIGYLALLRPEQVTTLHASGDAASARWSSVRQALRKPLAFDHKDILSAALARLRERESLVFGLVGAAFTISELREAREAIHGEPIDRGNFRRSVQRMLDDGLLIEDGLKPTRSRPATLYRLRG